MQARRVCVEGSSTEDAGALYRGIAEWQKMEANY